MASLHTSRDGVTECWSRSSGEPLPVAPGSVGHCLLGWQESSCLQLCGASHWEAWLSSRGLHTGSCFQLLFLLGLSILSEVNEIITTGLPLNHHGCCCSSPTGVEGVHWGAWLSPA